MGSTEAQLNRAIEAVAAYRPPTLEQGVVKREVIEFCRRHPDALERSCRPGHVVASALVVDERRSATLLTLHAKIGRWLQLGGHCDGEGDLPRVALREAREESGLAGLRLGTPEIVDLDIHRIDDRRRPSHLHYDVRYLVVAPTCARPRRSHESTDLRWLEPQHLKSLDLDAGLWRLIERAFGESQIGG